jgi:hypothetical protein
MTPGMKSELKPIELEGLICSCSGRNENWHVLFRIMFFGPLPRLLVRGCFAPCRGSR